MTSLTSLRWSSNLTCRAGRKKPDVALPRFILIADDNRTACPLDVVRTMPNDAAVIVRSENHARLIAQVTALRPICTSRGIALLAATPPHTAALLEVDGIHLSEAAVQRSGSAAFRFAAHWIVTASAHSVAAVRRARGLGVDGILISPVFPTRSHPGERALGPMGYRRLARHAPEQACPLGGITPKTLRQLKGAPVAAIAGIGLFLDNGEAR